MNCIKQFFSQKICIVYSTSILFFTSLLISFYSYVSYLGNGVATELSNLEQARFEGIAKTQYDKIVPKELFWQDTITTGEPTVNAKSAITIDVNSGSILYEYNADEIIPPASMTKLFGMYVVFEEISRGRISLDDIVPLPPETWWVNAPPHSSLMFLNDGHIVTLQEVLLGLNISSGNDAAVAIANYVSGSMDSFIGRMNDVAKEVGLVKTHFVDSSGYSAKNQTTAREFAQFARIYVQKYPETLELFHSVEEIAYPQEHNLPSWRRGLDNPIVQRNTNPTLGKIEGVTGLKTGFIDESGYNLSLTVKRDSAETLTVFMGGPGTNSREGNVYRLKDSNAVVDYIYTTFKTADYGDALQKSIPVLEGKEDFIYAKEAWTTEVTVPYTASRLTKSIVLDSFVTAPISQGEKLGTVVYNADDLVVQEVPLLADRTIEKDSKFMQMIDTLVALLL